MERVTYAPDGGINVIKMTDGTSDPVAEARRDQKPNKRSSDELFRTWMHRRDLSKPKWRN